MPTDTKYGWIGGGHSSFALPMGASEVIKGKSGRFVKSDGSGRGEIAGDTHGVLYGFIEGGDETLGATEGATEKNCIDDVTAKFRVPLAYDGGSYTVNYSSALLGKTCDLVVVASIQKVNLTDSDEDTLIVVGGKAATSITADDGYVEVRLNPNEMHAVGV